MSQIILYMCHLVQLKIQITKPISRSFSETQNIKIDNTKDWMPPNQRTVLEAAKLMHQQDVGDIVVMDGIEAKGIVTEIPFLSLKSHYLYFLK